MKNAETTDAIRQMKQTNISFVIKFQSLNDVDTSLAFYFLFTKFFFISAVWSNMSMNGITRIRNLYSILKCTEIGKFAFGFLSVLIKLVWTAYTARNALFNSRNTIFFFFFHYWELSNCLTALSNQKCTSWREMYTKLLFKRQEKSCRKEATK